MKKRSSSNYVVYKAYKWETYAAKTLPYYLPFMPKRQRARLRSYFKNRWKTRLNLVLTGCLMKSYNQSSFKVPKNLIDEDYSWEVITNNTK